VRKYIETKEMRGKSQLLLWAVFFTFGGISVLAYNSDNFVLALIFLISAIVSFTGACLVNIGKALHSCSRFFAFILVEGLLTSAVSATVISETIEQYTVVSLLGTYTLFIVVFCIVWVLASLLVDVPVAKLANTIVNTITGIATALGNFFFLMQAPSETVGLPSELIFIFSQLGYSAIGVAQIMFNVVLIGFLCSGLLASLAVAVKEYIADYKMPRGNGKTNMRRPGGTESEVANEAEPIQEQGKIPKE